MVFDKDGNVTNRTLDEMDQTGWKSYSRVREHIRSGKISRRGELAHHVVIGWLKHLDFLDRVAQIRYYGA